MKNPLRTAGTGSKDVLLLLDGLGYEYQLLGNKVTIDPRIIKGKDVESYQNSIDSLVGSLMNRHNLDQRQTQKIKKLIVSFKNIPPIKGVEFVNLLADLTLIIISSVILFHFLLYSPTAIGELSVLSFIGVIASDSVRSLLRLVAPVTDILTKKYKFQKNQTTYEIGYSKLLRMLILMKCRNMIYSFMFLSIFLLGIFFSSAPIQFVSETIDFIAIFFATGSLFLRGMVNLKLGRSARPSSSFFLSTAIGVFFLILFLLKVTTHDLILYYLFVIFEAPLLIFYFLQAVLDVRVFPV